MNNLLLDGPDKAFGHPIGWGLLEKGEAEVQKTSSTSAWTGILFRKRETGPQIPSKWPGS